MSYIDKHARLYLTEKRLETGLSVKSVATQMKVHPQYYYNMEKGIAPVPAKNAKALAKVLNVPITDIAGLMTLRFFNLYKLGMSAKKVKNTSC